MTDCLESVMSERLGRLGGILAALIAVSTYLHTSMDTVPKIKDSCL